ncbi:hypothetical protein A3A49_02595 [Candidatus Curtissbacteria bacterium RIFCSPLOWO2_01_FULL_38_11b]|uniref:SH3b domain-containing protein n=1 Tax=Candidatus Curtissbacteria bacterium RIFCSPLOWO2_01_FULL_38_11b TaxID=1797725 RepID=A0A1F5H401_9BACT|nr:MAG: hypothetical protein A3A49_02595 [Candidatus Curtissbacteria bacterium RIFCSPLOWO2_01_FULL_38_11b]
MPISTLYAKRLKTNAKKKLKILLALRSFSVVGSLVLILSGCSAIGYSKPAALQVTSTPQASVFLDGKHIGKTPFYSDQLKAQEYTIKVTVSDATYVDKITLTQGTLTVVNRDLSSNFLAQSGENLSLVPSSHGFFVISWPADADITIDGKYIAKTPSLVKDLIDTEHKVLISKTGFVDREFAIKSSSKYQLLADVTLASQVAKGVTPKQTTHQAEAKQVEILSAPGGFVRLRRDPNTKSEEIGRIKSGETAEVIQETDDYFQVKFEGKLGWIPTQYTKEVE